MIELQPKHAPPTSFISKYLISYDHKVIAKQFMWASFFFALIGGGLAYMIRWQWAFPGQPIPLLGSLVLPSSNGAMTPSAYNSTMTMHGLIMIFWFITPLMIGAFGNFCIPLLIGARDMAFPWLNMASFWVFLLSGVLLISAFFVPLGAAGAAWTTYAPLSTNVGMPGAGQTLVVAAIFVTGVATIMGSVNYVTTVIRLRAPGMTWMRMPLTVWGLWLTAILNVLFVPVLGSAGLLLIMDRTFGTQFFVAGSSAVHGGGDPILFQHLFWIFGHPEVYILILPAWGFVSDLVAFFSRKPAYWYRGSVYAMSLVSVLSAIVYGHHMFLTGMSPMLGQTFMLFTLIISVPAEMLFLNWLHTIWKGSNRFDSPMLFACGTIFVFGLGGLTGLPLGTISTDLHLHDTMWVVGHFHLTMASAAFLGSIGALVFWFPKMFGRQMDERLAKIHFWFSFIGLTLLFCGQLVAGFAGQPRWFFDPYQYSFTQHLLGLNRMTSFAAFGLIAGQVFLVINIFRTIFGGGEKASNNPWEVGTLEWEISSPPPVHNFDSIPTVVRGPHEFANPEVIKRLGRDWISQTEELPSESTAAAEDKATA